VYDSNSRLFASEQEQFNAGAVSQQSLLTQRLTLLEAEQNLRDTQRCSPKGNVHSSKTWVVAGSATDAEVASVPAAASSPVSSPVSPPASSSVSSPVSQVPVRPARRRSPTDLQAVHSIRHAAEPRGLDSSKTSSHEVTFSALGAVVYVSDLCSPPARKARAAAAHAGCVVKAQSQSVSA